MNNLRIDDSIDRSVIYGHDMYKIKSAWNIAVAILYQPLKKKNRLIDRTTINDLTIEILEMEKLKIIKTISTVVHGVLM